MNINLFTSYRNLTVRLVPVSSSIERWQSEYRWQSCLPAPYLEMVSHIFYDLLILYAPDVCPFFVMKALLERFPLRSA